MTGCDWLKRENEQVETRDSGNSVRDLEGTKTS